jgi:hypothetical protein
MADLIKLAKMPKGKAFKTLSIYEKMYIDDNYQYEPVARMANVLKLLYIDVDVYCKNMGYLPTQTVRARPKRIAKSNIFDVDNYNTWTI